jgi:23S rRNA pseudouridine2457 synthase
MQLQRQLKPRYLLFNKPFNVLSSFTDPDGRATLAGYVSVPGVYAAGRLDYDSEGLLLLTDDGALIHRLTDPRHEHPKTYLVQVEGLITEEALVALRRGVLLRGARTRPAAAEIISDPALPARRVPVRAYHPTTWLKVVLREGKKRQLRRMTAATGFPALRLVRWAIGPITLAGLAPGAWRELTASELRRLRAPG